MRDKVERTPRIRITPAAGSPKKIVIVGGGAAGFAAAEMLRRQRYEGSIVMLSDDAAPPVDRPNLSKDYLAGTAPEEWVPLRDDVFYADQHIDLRLKTTVTAIDTSKREVTHQRWRQDRLRPPAARDRRRAGAVAAAGHGPAARAHASHARR